MAQTKRLSPLHQQRQGGRAPPGRFHPVRGKRATNNNRRLSLRTAGGIDALIALQGIEDPPERRRAVKHGRRALDALDELKLALLAGTLESWALLRLRTVAADLKDGSGVLGEIELRVGVELAKAGIN